MSPNPFNKYTTDGSVVTAGTVHDFHAHSDVDAGRDSQHHTLGNGPGQAAPGSTVLTIMDDIDRLQVDSSLIFADDFHTLTRWVGSTDALDTGDWTVQKPTDAEYGSTVFHAQDGYHVAYHSDLIPFDPNSIYRVRIRARGVSGAPKLYAGVRGYKPDRSQNVGTLPSGNMYIAASGVSVPVGSAWNEYVGYFQGMSAGGSAPSRSSAGRTGDLPTGTAWFVPIILPGYLLGAGEALEISMMTVDIIPAINSPVGMIAAFYGAAPSASWLLCNGSAFSGATWPELQTYIGGTTLPDLRDRNIVGVSGTKSLGSTGGSATVTLSAANIAHTHSTPAATTGSENAHTHGVTIAVATNTTAGAAASRVTTVNGGSASGTFPTDAGSAHSHSIGANTTGAVTLTGPTSVGIQNPYAAMNYYIKAESS